MRMETALLPLETDTSTNHRLPGVAIKFFQWTFLAHVILENI